MKYDTSPLKLLVVITERRNGKKVTALLNENGCDFHNAFLGTGTVPDELMAYLGLEPEKAVFLCFLSLERVKTLLPILQEELFTKAGGGLAFTLRVNSASNLDVVKFITHLNLAPMQP